MLALLISLVIIAVIAGGLGFSGVAAGAAVLAQIVFGVMLVGIAVLLALLLTGMTLLT